MMSFFLIQQHLFLVTTITILSETTISYMIAVKSIDDALETINHSTTKKSLTCILSHSILYFHSCRGFVIISEILIGHK